MNSFKKIEIEEDDVVFSVTPADGKYEYSIADDSSIISDGEFSINKYSFFSFLTTLPSSSK